VTLKRTLIFAGLALAAALAVLYVILDRTVHAPTPSLSRLTRETPFDSPHVTFVDEHGGLHTLTEFRRHYVLLNLWATWCAPCIRELPTLSRLAESRSVPRLVVVAVAIPPGHLEQAKSFLLDNDAAGLTPYFDAQSRFLMSFHANGLPVTVLIDPQGREIARAVGPQAWDSKESIDYLKRIANTE
jgi:thiol-disulfide isomerase/thioredoxin